MTLGVNIRDGSIGDIVAVRREQRKRKSGVLGAMRDLQHARGIAIIAILVAVAACDGSPRPAAASRAQALERPAQSGVASYYGPEFAGEKTASGERHRPDKMTAASPTLPLGAVAKVTNQETGQAVAVEVNDRGPYVKGRILDVSEKAATRLGIKHDGVAPVKVEPLTIPSPEP